MVSITDTEIFPLQDILAPGAKARMTHLKPEAGNWRWQVERNRIRPFVTKNLGEMTVLCGRTKKSPGKKGFNGRVPGIMMRIFPAG